MNDDERIDLPLQHRLEAAQHMVLETGIEPTIQLECDGYDVITQLGHDSGAPPDLASKHLMALVSLVTPSRITFMTQAIVSHGDPIAHLTQQEAHQRLNTDPSLSTMLIVYDTKVGSGEVTGILSELAPTGWLTRTKADPPTGVTDVFRLLDRFVTDPDPERFAQQPNPDTDTDRWATWVTACLMMLTSVGTCRGQAGFVSYAEPGWSRVESLERIGHAFGASVERHEVDPPPTVN